tara:strand:+ start:79 stop:714 length:636 start_codon:yes stop_codon:yes gene_type:complete
MDKSAQINTFNRYAQVSRETIISLNIFEKMLISANKQLNLIGKSTINNIWIRHFLDSAQVIDFVDKNDKTLVDLGSGAGFPGIVLAIMAKDKKIPLKVILIEKSPKKINFLNEIVKKLKLNVSVRNQNIFNNQNKFPESIFVARAFKPLRIILELMHNKAKNLNKIIIFLGKTGQNELIQASKSWDIKYKQRISITSSDSCLIEINKIEKK